MIITGVVLRDLYLLSVLYSVLLAPIIEETFKLLYLVGFMGILRSILRFRRVLDRSWGSEFKVLKLLTTFCALFFATFEYYTCYLCATFTSNVIRFVAHLTFTFLGITVALHFWKNVGKPASGFWLGVGSAALLHCLFNSAKIFGFTNIYQIFLLLSAWILIISPTLIVPNLEDMGLWTQRPDSWEQASTIQFKVKSKKPK